MTFDPSCAFLLNLDYENLFELASPPDDPEVFRCKGCGDQLGRRDRRAHWGRHRKHRHTYLNAHTQQVQHVTAKIRAALDTGDSDRASADAPRPSGASANGRPGESPPPEKEEEMAERKKQTTARPSRVRSTTTTTKQKSPEKTETGEQIKAALLKALKQEIGSFEVKVPPNENRARLIAPGARGAFCYVNRPGKDNLAIQITKPLKHIAAGLPKSHPWKDRKWGLTMTLKSSADIPAAIKGLKLAAAASQPDEDAPITAEAQAVAS